MAKIKTLTVGEMTVMRIVQQVSMDDLLQFMTAYYAGRPTRCMVWDVSQAPMGDFSSADASSLNTLLAAIPNSDVCEVAVVIAPDDMHFGMSRMFTAHAEAKGLVRKVGIVRSHAEAESWLGAPIPLPD